MLGFLFCCLSFDVFSRCVFCHLFVCLLSCAVRNCSIHGDFSLFSIGCEPPDVGICVSCCIIVCPVWLSYRLIESGVDIQGLGRKGSGVYAFHPSEPYLEQVSGVSGHFGLRACLSYACLLSPVPCSVLLHVASRCIPSFGLCQFRAIFPCFFACLPLDRVDRRHAIAHLRGEDRAQGVG